MKNELLPHQEYVLQLMAAPADILIENYKWDDDEVPVGLTNDWMVVFTEWYLGTGKSLLPGFADDIVEINEKRQVASESEDEDIWTNEGLRTHRFWSEIRDLSKAALVRRKIPVKPPDPNQWYAVLPEELQ